MRKLSSLFLTLISTLFFFNPVYSTTIPNTDHPVTFVGPTAKLGYASTINDFTAYSLMGELGFKNFRLGATVGWKIDEDQRFKLSGEYLWQKIRFAFFSGNEAVWVNQGAIGAEYQYAFLNAAYQPLLGIKGYLSHAPNKDLDTVTGVFINSFGVPASFIDHRRIAGSNGAGISPTLTFSAWDGGKIGAELNYDNVRYDTEFGNNEEAKGLGGTITLNQMINDDVNLGLSAAVRKPFNNYAANLNWTYISSPSYGTWMLGLFGEYNVGKYTLPNTYNAGITINYYFDQRQENAVVTPNRKGNFKDAAPVKLVTDDLLAWTRVPAVYMPRVLAIADRSPLDCVTPIQYIGPPAPPFDTSGNSFTFDMSQYFTGSPILYSIAVTVINNSTGSPSDFAIDPNTGLITYTTPGFGGEYNVTITGTNGCGSASVNFDFIND